MKGADAALDEAAGESILPKLFALAHKGDRGRWLDERTERAAGGHRFKLDGEKTLPSTPDERAALFSLAERLGQQFGAPSFFNPIDAARRISGVGSLGLPRFLLGVAGEGKPDDVRLLDVKAARKPAFAVGLHLPCPPPEWMTPNEPSRRSGSSQPSISWVIDSRSVKFSPARSALKHR